MSAFDAFVSQACDAIVRQNQSPPLELFFAAEALAIAAGLLDDRPGHAAAVATATASFTELSPDDQVWCRATLDKLTAA